MNPNTSIYIDPKLKEALQIKCIKDGTTVSEKIRSLITKELEK